MIRVSLRMSSNQTCNPFSTRFVRPDALPYLGDQRIVDRSIDRLMENGFVGQIVGPHGSGKTCLATSIQEKVSNHFDSIRRITIRNLYEVFVANLNSQGTNNQDQKSNASRRHRNQLLIVDGVERMPRLHQWLLFQNARRDGGLLITTHRRILFLPVVATIQPDFKVFLKVVDRLAPNHEFSRENLQRVFIDNNGDFRESLMTLYDQFQVTLTGELQNRLG